MVNRLKLKMTTLDDVYAVCRLDTRFGDPDWIRGQFWPVTQTPDELLIVCPQGCVPCEVLHEGCWRVIEVLGPLSFALTG